MNTSGIYAIKCIANGKVYIGQGANIRVRKNGHFSNLRRGCHKNKHLQRSFNKHGESSFIFCVIEYASVEMLDASELFWISFFKSNDGIHGYNSEPGGYRSRIISEETRAKISAAQKGGKRSAESNAKRSATLIGRKRSPEFCKKLGDIFRGRKASPEARANMSAAHKGIPACAKAIAAARAANLGRKHTPEAKRKMSLALLGKKLSPAHRAALSAAQKRRGPVSEKTRNLLKLVWFNRKQKIAV